ncbi:phosphoesterase [Parapedobacter defluvii]|uniref:Phosphoesterase n=1 Tax=Parapedobacter defluvii TaxID=2045106 RepID=A0ABQ1LEU8_9SPHI|nr:metallophosphoesterase family protein [Parapedobacter defluvii]GGC23680.1 phosphoesterase [Parapedobacter defluvii]
MKLSILLQKLTCTLLIVIASFFVQCVSAQSFVSSEYPDRITLTISKDPVRTQTVTWRTDSSVLTSKAQVCLDNGTPIQNAAIREIAAATKTLKGKDGRTDLYHHVVFDQLEPAHVYAYRVGDGEHWSEWFQFRTASNDTEPFSFIYLGDAQNDIKSEWSRVIRQSFRQQPDARFIIHAGDLINNANTDTEWGEWHYGAGFIHAMIPVFPTPGNHEQGGRDSLNRPTLDPHWTTQFTLPDNGPEEAVYYVDYQGVRIISLNSQTMGKDPQALDSQAKWLEDVLKNNPMKWTVITLHHPMYTTAKRRESEDMQVKERLKALYDQYGVDLVLQGHDHTYARGKGPNAVAKGPVYMLSVAGPKMYVSDSDRWMDVALEKTQLYQTITVTSGKLVVKAYKASGELFDSFELTK